MREGSLGKGQTTFTDHDDDIHTSLDFTMQYNHIGVMLAILFPSWSGGGTVVALAVSQGVACSMLHTIQIEFQMHSASPNCLFRYKEKSRTETRGFIPLPVKSSFTVCMHKCTVDSKHQIWEKMQINQCPTLVSCRAMKTCKARRNEVSPKSAKMRLKALSCFCHVG